MYKEVYKEIKNHPEGNPIDSCKASSLSEIVYNLLDINVKELSVVISELEERLRPVIFPATEIPESNDVNDFENTKKKSPESYPPLFSDLISKSQQISYATKHLRLIVKRLGL